MYLRMVLRSRPVRRAMAETDRPSRGRASTMTSSPSLSTDALPPATMAGGWTPKGSPVTGGHMPKVAGPRRQPGENSGALFEEYSPGTDNGWQRLSAGAGSKGERLYDWARWRLFRLHE